jgi:hypothetical protein
MQHAQSGGGASFGPRPGLSISGGRGATSSGFLMGASCGAVSGAISGGLCGLMVSGGMSPVRVAMYSLLGWLLYELRGGWFRSLRRQTASGSPPLALVVLLLYAAPSGDRCGRGEIGRRTRFRFWHRKMWGFESLRPHQFATCAIERPGGAIRKGGAIEIQLNRKR